MTIVSPPQPAELFAPVAALTTPITASAPSMFANAGAPESPVQAPRPLRWLRVQRPLVRFALADQLREWKHALARD